MGCVCSAPEEVQETTLDLAFEARRVRARRTSSTIDACAKNNNFIDELRQVSRLPTLRGASQAGSAHDTSISASLYNVVDAHGVISREASHSLGQIRNASFYGVGEAMVLEDTTTDPPTKIPLSKQIGNGGYGLIFLGEFEGRKVAVKAVHGEKHVRNIPECVEEGDEEDEEDDEEEEEEEEGNGVPNQELRDEQMAQLEAVLMSLMQHPHIVTTHKILSCFQLTDSYDDCQMAANFTMTYQWFIVMEYCSLGSLAMALKTCRFHQPCMTAGCDSLVGWDAWATLESLKEVVLALKYLHSNGIIHGDLKAGNVLLSDDSKDRRKFIVKVCDFGLSRIVKSTKEVTTKSIGTVTHMPPELLSKGILSPACDVYSFGLLMWEFYSAKAVHKHLRDNEVIIQVVNEGLRPPYPHDVPLLYKRLSEWCWTEDYKDRPSLAQVYNELNNVQGELCPLGPDSEPTYVTGQLPARVTRRGSQAPGNSFSPGQILGSSQGSAVKLMQLTTGANGSGLSRMGPNPDVLRLALERADSSAGTAAAAAAGAGAAECSTVAAAGQNCVVVGNGAEEIVMAEDSYALIHAQDAAAAAAAPVAAENGKVTQLQVAEARQECMHAVGSSGSTAATAHTSNFSHLKTSPSKPLKASPLPSAQSSMKTMLSGGRPPKASPQVSKEPSRVELLTSQPASALNSPTSTMQPMQPASALHSRPGSRISILQEFDGLREVVAAAAATASGVPSGPILIRCASGQRRVSGQQRVCQDNIGNSSLPGHRSLTSPHIALNCHLSHTDNHSSKGIGGSSRETIDSSGSVGRKLQSREPSVSGTRTLQHPSSQYHSGSFNDGKSQKLSLNPTDGQAATFSRHGSGSVCSSKGFSGMSPDNLYVNRPTGGAHSRGEPGSVRGSTLPGHAAVYSGGEKASGRSRTLPSLPYLECDNSYELGCHTSPSHISGGQNWITSVDWELVADSKGSSLAPDHPMRHSIDNVYASSQPTPFPALAVVVPQDNICLKGFSTLHGGGESVCQGHPPQETFLMRALSLRRAEAVGNGDGASPGSRCMVKAASHNVRTDSGRRHPTTPTRNSFGLVNTLRLLDTVSTVPSLSSTPPGASAGIDMASALSRQVSNPIPLFDAASMMSLNSTLLRQASNPTSLPDGAVMMSTPLSRKGSNLCPDRERSTAAAAAAAVAEVDEEVWALSACCCD